MQQFINTLERTWITAGSSELWGCDSTYCTIPYERLPVLKEIAKDFSWLGDHPTGTFGSNLIGEYSEISDFDKIISQASVLNLELPAEFVAFLSSPDLQARVPTCTDCYLDLSVDFFPVPNYQSCYLLRFLNDSQGCVLWYLLLRPGRAAQVVSSWNFLDPKIFYGSVGDSNTLDYSQAFQEMMICADSFLEFIYRFWIENTLWFALNADTPLTPREAAYKLAAAKNT